MTADDDVAAAVAGALGLRVRSALRVAGSVTNEDFLLRLADGTAVVAKLGPLADLVRETWVCGRLRSLGLPVPEVLVTQPPGVLPAPFLVMTVVEGGPSDRPAVLREAGRVLRRVHEVELPGFGPIVPDGAGARGAQASWASALAASVDGADELVAAGVLDGVTADRAVEVATGAAAGYDGPGRLLHRDLKPAHVFGLDDDLTGLIDWGDASVGDPLLDLARLSMAPPAVFATVLSGYDPEPVDDLDQRLAAYRVGWDLGTLVVEHRAGGDWFDVYRDRLRADVGMLGPTSGAAHRWQKWT